MICLRCDNEDFVPVPEAVFEQEYRGQTFTVITPGMACSKCGWTTVDIGQADELVRRTKEAYAEL